jgi:hypothetical protein
LPVVRSEKEMRYSPMAGKKIEALKAATDSAYRFVMLGMMLVELVLLGWLVFLEATRK